MHPTIFSFGPIQFHSYGLLVAIGVFFAVAFLRLHSPKIRVNPDTVVDLALVTLVAGFVGARIFYVIEFWDYFQSSLVDVFKIWQGGIVIYGGLIGGFIGFSIFIFLKKLPFISLLDLFMPALALAQGFGRIGCFLNGCCYGAKTSLPIGVKFPFLEYHVHPTQIYESLFCFALFFLLFAFWRRREKIGTGAVTLFYFILYALGRFDIEFFRGDNAKAWLQLTIAQVISIFVIILSLIVFLIATSYGRKKLRRSA